MNWAVHLLQSVLMHLRVSIPGEGQVQAIIDQDGTDHPLGLPGSALLGRLSLLLHLQVPKRLPFNRVNSDCPDM
jgi:hypothetical protein